MAVEIITREDLQNFRLQLLGDIKQLLALRQPPANVKPWLKSNDVRKLLNISPGKLQTLRISGKLRSSKIGGVHYYKYEDIQQLLESQTS
jgi:hypothetical protein